MFLSRHLNVILWKTEGTMLSEKGTISTVQNVDFRIGEFRVSVNIDCAIFMPDEFRPD
jgi:hypothetical protein